MADGTNIHEPVNGSLVETSIDSVEVSFVGAVRDRQRVMLAGRTAASDVAVLNTVPVSTEYGIVTRPVLPASFDVTVLNQTVPLTNTELRASPVAVAVSGAVTVGNFPAWVASEATLAAVRDRADFPLPAAQVTALKAVTVTNPTANPETGLAKDATLAAVRDRGTFPLPSTQVTDLKTVTVANPTANPEVGLAKETTLLNIRNRADFPLPPGQLADLKVVTGPLTNTELRATAVPVTGPLTDAQLRAARVATDTGLQQPLTDVQLRATAVPVSGPLTDVQLRAVRVAVDVQHAQPLTDAQLRATAVPVTGPLTDVQLRTAPVRVVTEIEARTLLMLADVTHTTSGTSAAFDTSGITRAAIDLTITAVAGVAPEMRFMLDRKGADGRWYPVWSSATATAPVTLSTTVGQGMQVAQSLAAQARLRWEISGTTPSFTFGGGVIGK